MFMHVYESIFLLDSGTAQNHQHLLANGAEADRNGQLNSTGRLREYRATSVSLFVRGKTAPLERIYIVSIFTMGEPEGPTAVWVRSLSADPSKRFARIARASNRRGEFSPHVLYRRFIETHGYISDAKASNDLTRNARP